MAPPTTDTAVAPRTHGQLGRIRVLRPHVALLLVGLLFLVLQLVLFPRPFGFSTDEATYLAKVDPSVPELYWTPQRAWGVPVLAWPVAVFSSGIAVVRTWFAVLSSVGLVAAFRPWLRILDTWVAPLAALLFSTTWFVLFFGPQAMPNLYVGLAAVAAVGWFLRAVDGGARRHVILAGLATAVLALVRPTDSVLVVAPVILCALVVRRLRRPAPMLALVVGGILGWLPWVIEAFLRFGGPIARLGTAAETGPGGFVLDPTDLLALPRLLDGAPLYFTHNSPLSAAGPLQAPFLAWLTGLVVLLAGGLVVAVVQRRVPEFAVLYLPAALLAVFYLLLTSVTALRFVIPVLALISLPCAAVVVHLLRVSRGSLRTVLVAAVVVGALTQVTGMAVMTWRYAHESAVGRSLPIALADALRPRMQRGHCLFVGVEPQATGFYLGCRVVQATVQRTHRPSRVVSALAAHDDVVAALRSAPRRGSYLAGWRRLDVPGLPSGYTAYSPPS